jgi:hypothetical protein
VASLLLLLLLALLPLLLLLYHTPDPEQQRRSVLCPAGGAETHPLQGCSPSTGQSGGTGQGWGDLHWSTVDHEIDRWSWR